MNSESVYILGETAAEEPLTGRESCQQVAIALVSQARRSLCLWSRDLERRVYDCPEFITAVRLLACRSRFSLVRLLVHDPKAVTQQGHRLLELARRLSSRIELRQVAADYQDYAASFLTVDEMGLILRPSAERYEGFFSFKAPVKAREQNHFFNEVWDKSQPHPEFRRLSS